MYATECREFELEAMENELERANTNPSLIIIFLAAITNSPDQREGFPCGITDGTIREAMEAQKLIGWKNFELGGLAKKWKTAQREYLIGMMDQTARQSTEQANRWSVIVQKCLWEFLAAVWKYRCQLIHGKDKDDKYHKARVELTRKIHKMHRDNMEVNASDRHLFS